MGDGLAENLIGSAVAVQRAILKNVHNGYNGWSKSDFDRAEAYAFVVVSSDGKRRSNVIMSGAK